MASASQTDPDLECPICLEDFKEPKILHCNHLACKMCLLKMLSTGGNDNGCPLCRSPIISPSPGDIDLDSLLDALPTNLAVMALVDSQKVLTTPHVCAICPESVKATTFCYQCRVKLCQKCGSGHQKLPATKNHTMEELGKLTARKLTKHFKLACKSHPDHLAEIFCPIHQQMICLLCAATDHEGCQGKRTIISIADDTKSSLLMKAKDLRHKEKVLANEIDSVKNRISAMRKSIKDTFEDLQADLQKRRHEMELDVKAKEDQVQHSLQLKETCRATLASNARTVEHLVTTAPQAALLGMMADLTSRLDQLHLQIAQTLDENVLVSEITIKGQDLIRVKSNISKIGCLWSTSETGNQTESETLGGLRVIIVGQRNTGKSSLANTLSGKENFLQMETGSFVNIRHCDWLRAVQNNIQLEIVDTPGLYSAYSQEEMTRHLTASLALSSPGPHVFLITIRCDSKNRQEDIESVQSLIRLFSKQMETHAIVVFTALDELCDEDISEDYEKLAKARQLLNESIRRNERLQAVVNGMKGGCFGISNNTSVELKQRQARDLTHKMLNLVILNGCACKHYKTPLNDRTSQTVKTRESEYISRGLTPDQAVDQVKNDIICGKLSFPL